MNRVDIFKKIITINNIKSVRVVDEFAEYEFINYSMSGYGLNNELKLLFDELPKYSELKDMNKSMFSSITQLEVKMDSLTIKVQNYKVNELIEALIAKQNETK